MSLYLLLTDGYPLQLEDTPIQKITIRPAKHFHRHSRPKGSLSHPNQAIIIDRFGKSHKKATMKEKLYDSPSNVVKIVKETPPRLRIHVLEHRRKAKGPINVNATHPIFYANARVNGSFRDQPIRSISAERN